MRNYLDEKKSSGKVSDGKMSAGKLSVGKKSDGKVSVGKCLLRKCTNGKMSNGKLLGRHHYSTEVIFLSQKEKCVVVQLFFTVNGWSLFMFYQGAE